MDQSGGFPIAASGSLVYSASGRTVALKELFWASPEVLSWDYVRPLELGSDSRTDFVGYFELEVGSNVDPMVTGLHWDEIGNQASPTRRFVPEGVTTSLVVTASGTAPLAYQWWRDGYRIDGATQATLVLSNLTAADSGDYTVFVTNAVGAVLSSPVRVEVIAPPVITRSPEATAVLSGSVLRLGVHATGSPPLSYRWLKEGGELIGSTSSNYVRGAATLVDAGLYTVVVTNLAGSVTSAPVSVRVLEPLRIARGPVGITSEAGQRVTLSVEATGSGPYTYEWRINGQAIPIERNGTARSGTLEIAAVGLVDMGSYTVVVANEVELVVSEPVDLTLTGLEAVVAGDAFTGPRSLPAGQGTLTTSTVGATREAGEPLHAGKPGGSSVWFQWTAPASGIVRVDTIGSGFDTLLGVYTGERVDGLTAVASDEDSGGFFTSALSFNAVGGVTYWMAVDGLGAVAGRLVLSWDFRAAVPAAPEIVEQPVGLTRASGERSVELRVVAREATGYQWLRNDLELAGETRPSLVLDPYGLDKVGIYEVRVSGPGGVVTSRAASMELGADRTVRATDKLAELLALRGGEGGVTLARASARRLGPGGFASPAWVLYQGAATFGFDNRRATTSPEEPTAGYRINQGPIWFDLRVQERGALKVQALGGLFPVILSLHPPADRNRLLHLGTNSLLEAGPLEAGSYILGVRGEDKGYIGLEVLLGQPPVRDDTVDTFEKALQGALVLTAPRVPPMPPPTYQWLREGREIEGANRSTYEVPAGGGVEHRGQYAVVIDNGLGRVTNALWKVEVVMPPAVGGNVPARWEGGRFQVGVRGTPGQRMVMMKTEEVLRFAAGEEFWMPMEGSGLYEDATASQRGWGFYRVLEKPLVPVWEGELKVGEKAMGGWRVEGGRLGQTYRVQIEGPGQTNVLNGIVREQPWHLQAPTGAVVRIPK